MRAIVIAIVCVAITGAAHRAEACSVCELFQDMQGGAFLRYELTELHAFDAPRGTLAAGSVTSFDPPPKDLVLAGFRLHGFGGWSDDVQYHVNLDLAAGATIDRGGFAYDVALFPVGAAVLLGRTGFVTFGAGVAWMGATRALDDATLLPLETNVEFDLGKRVRFLGRARAAWEAGAPARHDGAPSIPFADELEAMAGFRLGHRYEDWNMPSGNGYFLAASYKEMQGTKFIGLTIGYSIDAGTPDRQRERHHRNEQHRHRRRVRPV